MMINAKQCMVRGIFFVFQWWRQKNFGSHCFRGNWQTLSLYSAQNSGNFIDLVKLLSKCDPVLREHFRHIHENEIRDHYLSHEIQNE
jgi:hypothetical protein